MSEIYRNSINKGIEFSIPTSNVAVSDVTIIKNGEEYTANTALTDGKLVVQVPFAVTIYDGKFLIRYTIEAEGIEHVLEEEHEVVTPLFTKAQLLDFDADFASVSDSQIENLERIIRSLFKTLTGQSFGLTKESISVSGSGSSMLSLPKRSAEAVGPRIGDFSDGPFAHITNDGWVAEGIKNSSWIDVFEPTSTFSNKFRGGQKYVFSGLWGYKNVPEDIHLAAMTLASDYGCDSSIYQERYMKSVGTADNRFTFDGRAFIKTGNLKVDQILDRFSLVRMRIL